MIRKQFNRQTSYFISLTIAPCWFWQSRHRCTEAQFLGIGSNHNSNLYGDQKTLPVHRSWYLISVGYQPPRHVCQFVSKIRQFWHKQLFFASVELCYCLEDRQFSGFLRFFSHVNQMCTRHAYLQARVSDVCKQWHAVTVTFGIDAYKHSFMNSAMLDMHTKFTKRNIMHVYFHFKGSFILVRKRHRFHVGSQTKIKKRIRFCSV